MPLELHDRIAHIHLDYNGIHGLVSTTTGENFYINTRTGNMKSLKRIKVNINCRNTNLYFTSGAYNQCNCMEWGIQQR